MGWQWVRSGCGKPMCLAKVVGGTFVSFREEGACVRAHTHTLGIGEVGAPPWHACLLVFDSVFLLLWELKAPYKAMQQITADKI